MKPNQRSTLKVVAFASGVLMLILGWRGYAQKVEPPATSSEDGFRICTPTLGELAGEVGIGMAMAKLCYLTVCEIGLVITGGSALSLMLTSKAPRLAHSARI